MVSRHPCLMTSLLSRSPQQLIGNLLTPTQSSLRLCKIAQCFTTKLAFKHTLTPSRLPEHTPWESALQMWVMELLTRDYWWIMLCYPVALLPHQFPNLLLY